MSVRLGSDIWTPGRRAVGTPWSYPSRIRRHGPSWREEKRSSHRSRTASASASRPSPPSLRGPTGPTGPPGRTGSGIGTARGSRRGSGRLGRLGSRRRSNLLGDLLEFLVRHGARVDQEELERSRLLFHPGLSPETQDKRGLAAFQKSPSRVLLRPEISDDARLDPPARGLLVVRLRRLRVKDRRTRRGDPAECVPEERHLRPVPVCVDRVPHAAYVEVPAERARDPLDLDDLPSPQVGVPDHGGRAFELTVLVRAELRVGGVLRVRGVGVRRGLDPRRAEPPVPSGLQRRHHRARAGATQGVAVRRLVAPGRGEVLARDRVTAADGCRPGPVEDSPLGHVERQELAGAREPLEAPGGRAVEPPGPEVESVLVHIDLVTDLPAKSGDELPVSLLGLGEGSRLLPGDRLEPRGGRRRRGIHVAVDTFREDVDRLSGAYRDLRHAGEGTLSDQRGRDLLAGRVLPLPVLSLVRERGLLDARDLELLEASDRADHGVLGPLNLARIAPEEPDEVPGNPRRVIEEVEIPVVHRELERPEARRAVFLDVLEARDASGDVSHARQGNARPRGRPGRRLSTRGERRYRRLRGDLDDEPRGTLVRHSRILPRSRTRARLSGRRTARGSSPSPRPGRAPAASGPPRSSGRRARASRGRAGLQTSRSTSAARLGAPVSPRRPRPCPRRPALAQCGPTARAAKRASCPGRPWRVRSASPRRLAAPLRPTPRRPRLRSSPERTRRRARPPGRSPCRRTSTF